jgi:hypothetical protein
MERLGFLQLAKRFLQLGKDATTTPDDADDRYIQPRPPTTAQPPAGRTLSLKIFNRIQQSASASPNGGGGGEGSGGGIASDQRRSRKKFHSVKEGTIHRKENADPRLRIASVGRKHVFAGCCWMAQKLTFLKQYFVTGNIFIQNINFTQLISCNFQGNVHIAKVGLSETSLRNFTFRTITYFCSENPRLAD